MVALDQRESMRAMFAEHQDGNVTDAQVTDFKLTAGRILGPYASAVLVDRQFALDRYLDDGTLGPETALIAAGDKLTARGDEIVGEAAIDKDIDLHRYRARGVAAMKLLVLYRPDDEPARRIAMVDRFVERCRNSGMLSIIEPVSRPPRHKAPTSTWRADDGILAAAAELGARGADLYKAEVPLHGEGPDDDIRRRCAALTSLVTSPWVVLSSGVRQDRFPTAVELACREGASGFLAGRAVWRSCIGQPDVAAALRDDAAPRLQELGRLVDAAVRQG
jgi:sulfofructosephosphate aldolase